MGQGTQIPVTFIFLEEVTILLFLVDGTHIPDINKVGVGGDDIYQYMQVRLSSEGYIAYAGRVSSSGPVIA